MSKKKEKQLKCGLCGLVQAGTNNKADFGHSPRCAKCGCRGMDEVK